MGFNSRIAQYGRSTICAVHCWLLPGFLLSRGIVHEIVRHFFVKRQYFNPVMV